MSTFNIFADHHDGVHLIDASAGTGKTHTISDLVLRMLLEKDIAISDILVVTYTEAATEELREKVRQKIFNARAIFSKGTGDGSAFFEKLLSMHPDHKLAHQRLGEALQGFDEAAVFTIHGFCQRMLWENNLETGTLFDTELLADQRDLLQEIVEDFLRIHLYEAPPLFIEYACKLLQPGVLFLLLQRNLNKPDLKIIPQIALKDINKETGVQEQVYLQIFAEARNTWLTAKEKTAELLLHSGLHKSSYKPENVQKWLLALDGMFESGCSTVTLFDKFESFTSHAIIEKTTKGNTPPAHLFFDVCEKLWEARKALVYGYDQQVMALQCALFPFAREQLAERKQQLNIHSFDDLLLHLRSSLIGKRGVQLADAIRAQYPVALIDEFQDTDPVQYTVFDTIYGAGKGLLFLIGDPKQSIYSFRGADIFTYIQAVSKAKSCATLKENWRSAPELIQAVNTLFGRVKNPFLYEQIEFIKVSPAENKARRNFTLVTDALDKLPLQIWMLQRSENDAKVISKATANAMIARAVAGEIVTLLEQSKRGNVCVGENNLSSGDIAILVRTNRQARLMQDSLRSFGVASVLHSSGNLSASREAYELELLLLAISEPVNEHYLKAALATEMLSIAGEYLDVFKSENATLEDWRRRFYYYHDVWLQHGFIRMFRELLDNESLRAKLLSYNEGERRITNVLHLMEMLHRVEVENDFGMTHLLKYLADQITEADDGDEEHQLRLESDADRVKIVTIHKAKGLQYPVVFCPFSWAGPQKIKENELFFHLQDEDATPVLDLGSANAEQNRIRAHEEQLAEDIRLLYVALTRAEYRCYLCWGVMRDAESSAMAYLLHQQRERENGLGVFSFPELSDEAVLKDLNDLASESAHTIHISNMPVAEPMADDFEDVKHEEFLCKEFSGTVESAWRIASFSSLTQSKAQRYSEGQDYDAVISSLHSDSDRELSATQNDIFAFPHGAAAGVFMHDLLENLDFTAEREIVAESVQRKLMEYGYDISWQDALCSMLDNVLHVNLLRGFPGLKLACVPNDSKIAEMEFYYPVSRFNRGELQNLFQRFYGSSRFAGFSEKLADIAPSTLNGFLKGFIDLIFEFQGRYYLLDWKSNFLGNTVDSYHQDRLGLIMEKEMYILQYHIYTIALHRYLASRLTEYTYKDNFGGIFYIFLRGVSKQRGPECGIFYDLPHHDLVAALNEEIGGAG